MGQITYKFEKKLQEALIKKRKNRFIFEIEKEGSIFEAHCPCTGSIGGIVFENIPCLISESDNEERKTRYTVEAISLESLETSNKHWIGINQSKANAIVEHFIKTNQLSNMVSNGHNVKRERKLGNSRIDFKCENTYIENKTSLQTLQLDMPKDIVIKRPAKFNSYDRFLKHINEISDSLEKGYNAVLLSLFIYDAKRFIPPSDSDISKFIAKEVAKCAKKGVKFWQVNLEMTPFEIKLISYFDITDDFIF